MRWAVALWLSVACTGCSLLFTTADRAQDGGISDGGVADATAVGETCGDTTCPVSGYCVTTGAGEVCQCLDGFEGPDCANIDDCSTFSCRNDGICVDGVESFTCDCTGNWTGDRCDDELCPSTTLLFSSVISNCQSSPVQTADVSISSTSGMLCVPSTAMGVGSDGIIDGNENLTLTFPQPVFLEVNSANAQSQGETRVIGMRMGVQVYDATWTSVGTFQPWKETAGGTLDTLTITAQNNGGRSLQSIKFWTTCQAGGSI